MNFVYQDLSEAWFDLQLFSGMNMNQDRPMYLVHSPLGYVVQREMPEDAATIRAIAVNRKIFSE